MFSRAVASNKTDCFDTGMIANSIHCWNRPVHDIDDTWREPRSLTKFSNDHRCSRVTLRGFQNKSDSLARQELADARLDSHVRRIAVVVAVVVILIVAVAVAVQVIFICLRCCHLAVVVVVVVESSLLLSPRPLSSRCRGDGDVSGWPTTVLHQFVMQRKKLIKQKLFCGASG
jgi:hypothetical protein